MTDSQVKKLARGHGTALHDAENAQNNRVIMQSSEEWDAFYATLSPKQQKLAAEAHRAAHYAP